jgi:AbrB family looped-hinge helix DNA binding protein
MPFLIGMGMTLKIDKAGRIVVPKPVRERLGLRAGMDLEVAEKSDGLLLKPVAQKPSMMRVKGFWVHQGVAPKNFDWDRLLEEQRDSHLRKLLGP